MALALSLVGQPVHPYLTTGATDFVNSVQKGKEDAIRTEELKTQSQKSALDILSAKKKVDESSWATTNATDLKAKADKGQLDAESMARMQEANPEFAKILGTAQADAVKNFYASNLIGLNSATDQAGFLNGLVQAHDAHNAPLPESVRKDPKLAIQYYKMLLNGAKAFDDKTASMDESGNVITKDALGQTTAINPAAVKATKATPVIRNGKRVTQTIPLPNGRTRTEQLMSDDTWQELDTSAPPAPKAEKTPQDRPQRYFPNDGLTGEAFLETLPAQDKARVKAILRYDMPFPSTMAIRRDPNMARFAEAVFKADPSYTDMGYSNKKTSAKAFLPGQKLGNLILSNASARGHMDVLQEVYDAMQNGDIKKLNDFANHFRVQTGSAPEATFDAIKGAIGSEIMKSIVPGGGGVVEREEIRETLSRGYAPQQFMSVLNGYRALMQEQYDNMHQDYKRMELPEKQWPTYKTHAEKKADEGKKPTGNQGKQPQTPREWYEYHWYEAQKKGDKVRMQKLTEEARRMGIAK